MEREQMIEEMLKDINEAVAKNIELVEREYYSVESKLKYHGMGTNINTVGIVNELVAANYCKIPKGAVVLTKEQQIADIKANTIFVDKERENARKETAREIYDQLRGHGTTYVKKWIKEKYGVEVEE